MIKDRDMGMEYYQSCQIFYKNVPLFMEKLKDMDEGQKLMITINGWRVKFHGGKIILMAFRNLDFINLKEPKDAIDLEICTAQAFELSRMIVFNQGYIEKENFMDMDGRNHQTGLYGLAGMNMGIKEDLDSKLKVKNDLQ